MSKQNYNVQMHGIIDALAAEKKPKLLLHCCCACCATSVCGLLEKHFELTLYYYNPNIFPESEYFKRLDSVKKFLKARGTEIALIAAEYNPDEFYRVTSAFEDTREGGVRCGECIKLRLEETAKLAKIGGYEYFASTLSVSPMKNAVVINGIGKVLGDEYGIKYLVNDFKKEDGYKRSVELSREYGLYRQDYCGCRASLIKSEEKKNG